MLEAIRAYLEVALGPTEASTEALCRALDRLALAYWETPVGEQADDDREPPEAEYSTVRALIEPRFPDLGWYAVVDPMQLDDPKVLTGDAIDDIADIASDVSEILWRAEQLGLDDACWWFRFDYRTHWGRHLHDLRAYLHTREFYG